MQSSEIRAQFLNYFKKMGHMIVESASLVPKNDPSLLFTNAGMVQFKDVFLGKEKVPYPRVASIQRCLRVGGKHNDLENVGFTARHHTFFEMLGNFSFGDYFKKEAIHFAWDFLTQILKLPPEQLYITVYEKDELSMKIWHQQEKIPLNRIYCLGERENFWMMSDIGPCGPCSEIYIDRGKEYGCGKTQCHVGCDCDRYLEIWNLVFMEYVRMQDGQLVPLPQPCVDTGAGLERLSCILQNQKTNYETDIFSDIIKKIAQLTQKIEGHQDSLEIAFRVIADHARAACFLVGDGIFPTNEGRGYILRKLIRRAIHYGKKIGIDRPFLYQVVGFVIDQMKAFNPDLVEKQSTIEKVVHLEENQFFRTLEKGLGLLNTEIAHLKSGEKLSGQVAFKLYDTYGFPLNLTQMICLEKGIQVDQLRFKEKMQEQRCNARKHWKGSGDQATTEFKFKNPLKSFCQFQQFIGDQYSCVYALCIGLYVQNGDQLLSVDHFPLPYLEEKIVYAIFQKTPFYPESGGQVGDQGRVWNHFLEAKVIDTQNSSECIVVQLEVVEGEIRIGQPYFQEIDQDRRNQTSKNHTATHLLHWALRKTLGNHVRQAGSWVGPDLMRFDFTHFKPMSQEEIFKVETLIQQKIWNHEKVSFQQMKKEEALKLGAHAFFGEKYQDQVRVVSVGSFSKELCGGTHVQNCSEIHIFKIANEFGIAAGVRRMIAYTSENAFQYLRTQEQTLKKIQKKIQVSHSHEVLEKLEHMIQSEKILKEKSNQFDHYLMKEEVQEILEKKQDNIVIALCKPNIAGAQYLKKAADYLRQKLPQAVIVLGIEDPAKKKAYLLATLNAQKNLDARELITWIASEIQGQGGGKLNLAQAGGSYPAGLQSALQKAQQWILERLG